MSRLMQVAIAFDQLLNSLTPGGYADETLSARAWREGQDGGFWGFARGVIDGIFFWQTAHCYQAYLSEVMRKQYPEDYRS